MRKILFLLLLAGCANLTLPVTYTPQNIHQADGVVHFREARYGPYLGGVVDSNQLQNQTAVRVRLSEDISDLVYRANILEFRHSGGTTDNNADVSIDIVVDRFFAGDIGTRVRWEYEATYLMYRDGELVYTHKAQPEPVRTGKGGQASDYTPTIQNMIREGYGSFITDPDVQKIISQ